jgi:hypothetical protein
LDTGACTAACIVARQIWRRTDPIGAAARRAVDILAIEAVHEGGGPGDRKGIEAGVTCVTLILKEWIADCAVWLRRPTVDTCGLPSS